MTIQLFHFVCFHSFVQRSSDHQVLPVPHQRRRMGLDAIVRHNRSQQPIVTTALHRGRQLRPQVI